MFSGYTKQLSTHMARKDSSHLTAASDVPHSIHHRPMTTYPPPSLLSTTSGSPPQQQNKPWKKVLYERQPYPDNYVDNEKFLSELDMNSTSPPLTFYGIFLNTAVIVQQITAVTIFVSIHKFIVKDESYVSLLFLFDGLILCTVYIVSILFHETILLSFKSLILFLICLRIIAPILQTLTSSYSDDTIHALVIIFSTLHLVSHDYAYVNNTKDIFAGRQQREWVWEGQKIVDSFQCFVSDLSVCLSLSLSSGNLSLNAAMFTAVLLASRLQKIELVTAFISLAIISFSFLPRTLKLIKRQSLRLHLLVTVLMWGTASILLSHLDRTLHVIYQISIGFVWIVCPLWLSLLSQTNKKRLRGPWDIADLPDCDESSGAESLSFASLRGLTTSSGGGGSGEEKKN
jgi:phosphatidylinositol N-acetylglucosaminyltransferase subunit C